MDKQLLKTDVIVKQDIRITSAYGKLNNITIPKGIKMEVNWRTRETRYDLRFIRTHEKYNRQISHSFVNSLNSRVIIIDKITMQRLYNLGQVKIISELQYT